MLFVGKGVEILTAIALDGPCTQYHLRENKHWSSRTVWKQTHRLEEDGLIRRIPKGYEVTDFGFYVLVPSSMTAEIRKRLVTKAIARYPDGQTQKAFGYLLQKTRGKIGMEKELIEDIRAPNAFVVCRTDADGRIVWLFRGSHAVDPETGRFGYRLLKRLPGRANRRWRTINIR
jgi:DNA-binding Lrp family transcriptional regulator